MAQTDAKSPLQKLWHDPVWSKVISGGILAAISYSFYHWWPAIRAGVKWGQGPISESVSLPNWLVALLVLITLFQVVSIMQGRRQSSSRTSIDQLISSATDLNSSVTELLLKAKAIATSLEQKDFLAWINNELNGYPGVGGRQLPTYRQLHGELVAFNQHRGWEPVQFQSAKMRETCSFGPLNQDIASLEEMLRRDKEGSGHFSFTLPPEAQQFFANNLSYHADVDLRIPASSIYGIMNAVRNAIHDWALKL